MTASQRLPNLVLAGVTKAGTTSLVRYLNQHPDIGTIPGKGPDHFTPLRYGPAELPPVAAYAAHFAGLAQRYVLDGSITYFTGGHRLATALDRTLGPDARVLIAIREPVARLWSSYKMKRTRGTLPPDISDVDAYVERCLALHEAGLDRLPEHATFASLRTGRYAEHLPAWTDTFGDRLEVVLFDDLAADPAATVERLCRWLDLDPAPVAGFDLSVSNRTVEHRHPGVRRAVDRMHRRAWRYLRANPRLEARMRTAYRAINTTEFTETLPAATGARLQTFYAGSNEEVGRLLRARGADALPAWLEPDTGRPLQPTPAEGARP